MNYLVLIYVKVIDQIIINHGKHQDQCDIVLKSFVPKVVPQPWMPPWMVFESPKGPKGITLHSKLELCNYFKLTFVPPTIIIMEELSFRIFTKEKEKEYSSVWEI